MRAFLLPAAVCLFATAIPIASAQASPSTAPVKLLRTPEGGVQPQGVVDAQGILHLVFLKNDPKASDVFYARRAPGSTNFSKPLRVNSEPGSGIAIGTIRGAQLALGRNGLVHVAWNGSGTPNAGRGSPMLYARLNDTQTAFEPQRNLMTSTMNLDGGGSVAADDAGNVFVIWHGASVEGPKGEPNRAVYMARSADDGKTFTPEQRINPTSTGACGCCGLKAYSDPGGRLAVLYRAAGSGFDRDVTLLLSQDRGTTFQSTVVGPHRLGTCPMSSMDLATGAGGSLLAIWEKDGQVYESSIAVTPKSKALEVTPPAAPEGKAAGRKHPVVVFASTAKGQLTAWTEGTGWNKGGALAWELELNGGGKVTGRAPGVPVWSRITAVAEADGTFTIVY